MGAAGAPSVAPLPPATPSANDAVDNIQPGHHFPEHRVTVRVRQGRLGVHDEELATVALLRIRGPGHRDGAALVGAVGRWILDPEAIAGATLAGACRVATLQDRHRG
jgi:hypothetical protein